MSHGINICSIANIIKLGLHLKKTAIKYCCFDLTNKNVGLPNDEACLNNTDFEIFKP